LGTEDVELRRMIVVNSQHLGDSKDVFKRGFIDLARSTGVIRGPRLLPMFTDIFQGWQLGIYLALLGLSPNDLVSAELVPRRSLRTAYFSPALSEAHLDFDLFLDPDRGLGAPGRGRRGREVITPAEVITLLLPSADRILMVYDEALNRFSRRLGMVAKLEVLTSLSPGASAFSYFNEAQGHPSVICIANEAGFVRLNALRRGLSGMLPQGRFLPLHA
jgi:hypothetical protein